MKMTSEERWSVQQFGWTLLSRGQYKKARELFEGLTILNPGDVYAWRALARSWREQRDTAPRGLELALDAIANAERVSPAPDVEVLVEYAELLLFKGEVALATSKLREACSAAGRMPRHDEASLEAHQRARALLSACSNQTK